MSTERNKEQAGALKQYEYTDAVETAKAYFKGDDLAATVWVSKYALKDSMGKIYENSPEQMHRRIAREIERIEKRYPNPMSESEVYDLLKDFRYLIPQGGPMTGLGNNLQIASLPNCFVNGHRKPADSYGGIILALIHIAEPTRRTPNSYAVFCLKKIINSNEPTRP